MPRSFFVLTMNSVLLRASGAISKTSKLKWRLNGARNSRHHNFAANLMELFLLLRLQFEQSVSYTPADCSDRRPKSRVCRDSNQGSARASRAGDRVLAIANFTSIRRGF